MSEKQVLFINATTVDLDDYCPDNKLMTDEEKLESFKEALALSYKRGYLKRGVFFKDKFTPTYFSTFTIGTREQVEAAVMNRIKSSVTQDTNYVCLLGQLLGTYQTYYMVEDSDINTATDLQMASLVKESLALKQAIEHIEFQ